MNKNEKKSENTSERFKEESVFSFLKGSGGSPGGTPQQAAEPSERPEPRPQQELLDLRNKLSEMENKIKKLELDAAEPSASPGHAGVPELIGGIESRLAALENMAAAEPPDPVPGPDLEEKLQLIRVSVDKTAELDQSVKAFEKELKEALLQIAAADRAQAEREDALKNLLAEERGMREEDAAAAGARLDKLEKDAASCSREEKAALAELSRRVEEHKNSSDEVREMLEAAREREESLERALKKSETALRTLLAEERRLREEAAAQTAELLNRFERETSEIKLAVDKAFLGLAATRDDILRAADIALADGRERLEAVAQKMQGEVAAAAGAKFSTLKSLWEGIAVEVRNSQKTAFCALEKCEKLSKTLSFLDQKTGLLERKYSRYEGPLKRGDLGERGNSGEF